MQLNSLRDSAGPTFQIDTLERGVLRGRIVANDKFQPLPRIELCIEQTPIALVEIVTTSEDQANWSVRVPGEALSDGLTILLFRDADSKAAVGTYLLRAGSGIDDDALAELAAVRAELDALKRAFLADASEPKLRVIERDMIVAQAVEAATTALADLDLDPDLSSGTKT